MRGSIFAEPEEGKTEASGNKERVKAAFQELLEQRKLSRETFREFFDESLIITKNGVSSNYEQVYQYSERLLADYKKIEIQFLRLQDAGDNCVKAVFLEQLFFSEQDERPRKKIQFDATFTLQHGKIARVEETAHEVPVKDPAAILDDEDLVSVPAP